jgi:hypothetical protein
MNTLALAVAIISYLNREIVDFVLIAELLSVPFVKINELCNLSMLTKLFTVVENVKIEENELMTGLRRMRPLLGMCIHTKCQ